MKKYLKHKILNLIDIKELTAIEYLNFDGKYSGYIEKHDFWELCFVEKGEIKLTVEDNSHLLSENSLILIPPNKSHSYYSKNGNLSRVFVICFQCFSQALRPLAEVKLDLKSEACNYMKNIITESLATFRMNEDELLEVTLTPPIGGQQMIILLLECLIINLLRLFSSKESSGIVFISEDNFYKNLIDTIIVFLRNNINKKLTLDKISPQNRAEVLCDPYAILDNAVLDSFDDAVYELEYFKKHGGQTIIDCTPDEIGRNPLAMKEISDRTGVNIILGCGHYYHKAHADYVKSASVKQLADEMCRDILEGIGDTGIKAGIIGEIGTSAEITDDEKKVLHAAGIAGYKTGRAIHVHTDLYTENGFEVVDILTSEGVKPDKICIDHVDVLLRPDYIRSLLKLGVYVEFDNFGKEFYTSKSRRFAYDLERIKLLKTLIDEGYEKKILLCNDICLKTMWKTYGGAGYAHILRGIKYMAAENGIDEKTYMSMLNDNVKNFIK